jgi:hypothetical protein
MPAISFLAPGAECPVSFTSLRPVSLPESRANVGRFLIQDFYAQGTISVLWRTTGDVETLIVPPAGPVLIRR